METKYHTNSHSKYLIKLHFVFAVKYRKNLIHDILKNDLIEIITDICLQKKYTIDAIQSDGDHIHILLDIQPIVSAYEVAHQLKQISTYRIYKKHSSFLKKHFWSDGYFVCSTGNASMETIRKYIEEQGVTIRLHLLP